MWYTNIIPHFDPAYFFPPVGKEGIWPQAEPLYQSEMRVSPRACFYTLSLLSRRFEPVAQPGGHIFTNQVGYFPKSPDLLTLLQVHMRDYVIACSSNCRPIPLAKSKNTFRHDIVLSGKSPAERIREPNTFGVLQESAKKVFFLRNGVIQQFILLASLKIQYLNFKTEITRVVVSKKKKIRRIGF